MTTVLFWGTHDIEVPRTRILKRGLIENQVQVHSIHRDLWAEINDRSQIKGIRTKLRLLGRAAISYPVLIWRYLTSPKHDVVIVSHPGCLDVLILKFFSTLRRTPLIWDAYISLYDTLVIDRKLSHPLHPFSLLLYTLEWCASRLSNRVLLDTACHANYFAHLYRLKPNKTCHVFVGAEPDVFPPKKPSERNDATTTVLFYGSFIPLHGVETIIKAAHLTRNSNVHWTLIGDGQEADKARKLISEHNIPNLQWHPTVPYEELSSYIGKADICLGIFGDTPKAARVIPNKVFQIVLSNRVLISRDSPAIRELLTESSEIRLINPADPGALVNELSCAFSSEHSSFNSIQHVKERIMPIAIGAEFNTIILDVKNEYAHA